LELKKIGKSMKFRLFTLFILASIVSIGQVQFYSKVNSRNVTNIDGIQFSIITNVDAEIEIPDFKGFKIDDQGVERGLSIVNGRRTQYLVHNYTLSAKKTGSLTIGAASMTYKGQKYKTNPITIKITKDNSYIGVISVNKRKIYQGESILATYKLYAKYQNVRSYGLDQGSTTTGFWKQELKGDWKNSVEVMNGTRYVVYVLKKEVLYAQQYGDLTISPYSGNFRIGTNYFNLRDIPINSNSVKIKVLPLPSNKPSSFSGSVGEFKMDTKLSRNTLKAGDALDLTLTISGKGNLSLLEEPEINFPDDFEVLDPEIENNSRLSASGLSGKKVFRYSIITSHSGQYKFGPIVFSYFDPSTKQYHSVSSDEFVVNVEKGIGSTDGEVFVEKPSKKHEIKVKNKGIRYLKDFDTPENPTYFFGSAGFYIALLFPGLLFIFFLFYKKTNQKNESSLVSKKVKKARKEAILSLSKGKKLLDEGNTNSFFLENSQALNGYLGNKLNIPISNFSKEMIQEKLLEKEVSKETSASYINLLTECEMARFGRTNNDSGQTVYERSIDVIEKIEEEIKI